jgi:hypothetical protein
MNTASTPTVDLKARLFATLQHSIIALLLLGVFPFRALAQQGHSHTSTAQRQEVTLDQRSRANALIKTVRDATERFKDVGEAEREHYSLIFGCVSGSDAGAMGLHYLNGELLDEANKTGILDPTRPQIVLYEPTADGSLRLTGADFVVFADAWNAKHPNDPPQLMGQLLHYFDSPNRFGLPAFYTLHVWAWKANPDGAFVNWHPNVSCQLFAPPTTP